MSFSLKDAVVHHLFQRWYSRRRFLKTTLAVGVAGLGVTTLDFSRKAHADATVSADRMRQVYEEVKTPYKHGMIISPPGDGHYDSPSVFRYNNTWYMMYVVYHNSGTQGYETLLASSTDLLHWTPLGTILPFRPNAWDSVQAAGYAALQDTTWDGTKQLLQQKQAYWLTYIGGSDTGYEAGLLSIGVASAATPNQATPWTRYDNPVLSPQDADIRYWEKTKLYKSNVIYDSSSSLGAPYVMYYNATTNDNSANSGVENIGMAISQDMLTWKRYGNDPVVSPDNTSYPNRVTGDPQVVKIGDTWTMFFWARYNGDSGTNVFNSFACSYDLVNWTKWRGEVLMTTTQPYERSQAHKPWIIKDNGIVYQFYAANGDQGFGIGLATSVPLNTPPTKIYAGASYTFIGDDPQQAIDGTVSYAVSPSNRWTAYASPNTSDWLQVQFPGSRTITGVALYMYDDGGHVQPPSSYNVEYWNPNAQPLQWNSTSNQARRPATPADGLNVTTFDAVNTSSIRVFFNHRGNAVYSGVTEMVVIRPVYEAEEASITHADIRQSSSAASGYYVGGIDYGDSSITFSDVYVATTSNYNLNIYYANGTSAATVHNLAINGGSSISVSYPPTGNWGQFSSSNVVTISVPLQAGVNTLTFTKGTNWAELDSIRLG